MTELVCISNKFQLLTIFLILLKYPEWPEYYAESRKHGESGQERGSKPKRLKLE